MPERPQNIFHDAVDEPYKGFLRLVERLSIRPRENDDEMFPASHILGGDYSVDDDTPFLPVTGLKAEFKLDGRASWQHHLEIQIGLGSVAASIELLHIQYIAPREEPYANFSTERGVCVEDGDYSPGRGFFAKALNRIQELESNGKLKLVDEQG